MLHRAGIQRVKKIRLIEYIVALGCIVIGLDIHSSYGILSRCRPIGEYVLIKFIVTGITCAVADSEIVVERVLEKRVQCPDVGMGRAICRITKESRPVGIGGTA